MTHKGDQQVAPTGHKALCPYIGEAMPFDRLRANGLLPSLLSLPQGARRFWGGEIAASSARGGLLAMTHKGDLLVAPIIAHPHLASPVKGEAFIALRGLSCAPALYSFHHLRLRYQGVDNNH